MVRVHLFSSLRFVVDDEPLDVRSGLTRSLLAYLIVNRDRPVDREQLSGLLWPDAAPSSARRNLREYLYRVRNLLERLWPDDDPLTTEDNLVYFRPPPNAWIDVVNFQQALATADASGNGDDARRALEEAIELYDGDLLNEYYDDWIVVEREQLRQQYVKALADLCRLRENAGDSTGALHAARRLVAEEPLRESAHRRVMRLYARGGDRARALEQYQRCRDLLKAELGAAPMPETDALYEQIRSGAMLPAVGESGGSLTLPPPQSTERSFVERQEELGALDEAYRAARESEGRAPLLLISGVAGSGKTRLAEEWLTRAAAEHLVLRGRSYEFEQHIAYRPVLDALQQALPRIPWELLPPDRTRAWLAPLARLLPDLYFYLPQLARQHDGTEMENAHAVAEGMAQLLLSIARRRPVALFIDDLQWADTETWRFLRFLHRRVAAAPLLLIGTLTEDAAASRRQRQLRTWREQGVAATIRLRPPTVEAVVQLLTGRLNRPVEEVRPFARRLHAVSGGNFLFITETIRALEQQTPAPAQLDHWPLPDAVQNLIETRLEQLGAESARRLGVAAALGRAFTFELLNAVAESDEESVLTDLEQWLSRGLLEEQRGHYDFTHAELREAAYARLTVPRRRRIHHRIARALERLTPAEHERIAEHFERGYRPVDAIPPLIQAGRRALERRAYDTAEGYGERLLLLLESAPEPVGAEEEVEYRRRMALAHGFVGDTGRAIEALRDAERLSRDPEQGCEVALRLAQIYWVRGDALSARDRAEEALEQQEAVGNTPAGRARRAAILRLLGRSAISLGNFEQAAGYLEEAIELDQNPAHAANAYGYLATAYAHLGRDKDAAALAEQAIATAGALESPALLAVAQVQGAVAYGNTGRWDRAAALAQSGLAACRRHELPVYAFVAQTILGRCRHHQGDSVVAAGLLHEALAWAEGHDYLLFRYLAPLYLAEIALHRGDHQTAQRHAGETMSLAKQTGNRWAAAQARAILDPL